MEAKRDGFRLSTGKRISANCGILGLGFDYDGELTMFQGYDGGIGESLTAGERVEVADYMIALWSRFKDEPAAEDDT